MKKIIVLLFVIYRVLYAEAMDEEKVISHFIYNFASHTAWPEGITNDEFEIYLISSNKKLLLSMKNVLSNQTLHGKKIKIKSSTKTKVPSTSNLVYVDKKYLNDYYKVSNQVEGRPVLLVSNAYENKRLVMINLNKTKNNTYGFEINKANILNQNLRINPKIILLGGTELDVAKLYKGAKNSLLQKEKELQNQLKIQNQLAKEISQFKKKNLALKEQYISLRSNVKGLEQSISQLHSKSTRSKAQFDRQLLLQKNTLAKEKKSTQKIRQDYMEANNKLDLMYFKLTKQEQEVEEKELMLSSLTQKVDQKVFELEALQKSLKTQDIQIQDQGETINEQKVLLIISSVSAFIFLILVFIIYKTLKREHKTNDVLTQTQKALEEQVIKTEKANASKTKFLAHMSHELRTPLNAVLGYSQLLQKDTQMSEKSQKTLETINRSGEHLLALINDVLEVSKIETGNIELEPVSFDLYQFLDDISEVFSARVGSEGLSLNLIKDKGLPQYILADINKVRQIFINIIGNSIKFTSEGGITIRVGHDLKNSTLLIEIEDTGEGIHEKEISKLFLPFKQTISGKLGGGGAGLGLSIVQEYLDKMGGTIKVKSKPAFGTVFYIVLPFVLSNNSDINKSEFHEIKSLKEEDMGIEVLIADDNKVNSDLLAQTLERVGFKVKEVENGLDALRVFKKERPRLVLLDIEMPVMNGKQALKEIRSLEYGKDTPILAVTASVFELSKKKALEIGFNALIRKPFKDYELFEEIAALLNIAYVLEEEHYPKVVSKVSLSGLDDALKEKLILATSKMKITELNKLIKEMENTYEKEARYLQKLSDDFDFKSILDALNQ